MNKIHYASHKTINKEPSEVIKEIKKSSFDRLEILSEKKHDLNNPKNIEVFRERPSDFSVSVHAPYHNLNLATSNEKKRKNNVKKIRNLIKNSEKIGSKHITIHPGYYEPKNHSSRKRAWEQNKKSFEEIAKIAQKHEIKTGIENMPQMPHILGKNNYELNGLVDSINNEYFSISLDIGHANTTNQLSDFLENQEHISHLHLHDNYGKKDQHLAIGEGKIDFQEVIKKIQPFEGILVIEARNIEQGQQGLRELKKIKQKNKPRAKAT